MKKYRYSEIFRSIQGEGKYTGTPTLWYRAWGCNFSCMGFGAADPSNVDESRLPVNTIDLTDIKTMKELPVFEFGCDSGYSWSKRYAHLSHQNTAEEICNELTELLPDGKFNYNWHMAFTGGEPMMSQSAIVDIMKEFMGRINAPRFVTIETNGTQMPRDAFIDFFGWREYMGVYDPGLLEMNNGGCELFWSCSPKLSASGESWNKAIKPEVLEQYNMISRQGQLKYVVDGTDKVWDEVVEATKIYRDVGVEWPVYIMPVGATLEEQEDIQRKVCEQTLDKGYNFSARLHCFIFGNEIGT